MHRGYVKEWRKELESDVWLMPPIYHRVWSWLRKTVNHKSVCVPTRKLFGIYILPGQKITSIQQIAESVSWVDGNKKTTPHKQTIARVLDWLVFHRMIAVTSDAYGTLISIENWDTYNGHEPSHVTLDVPPSVRPFTTNNNDKNVKNVKNDLKACQTFTEKQIRACIIEKADLIKEHFPHVNMAIETEEIVVKYRDRTIGADTWLIVSRWLKNLPKEPEKAIDRDAYVPDPARKAKLVQYGLS